jgi:DNA-binding IclR family transcriptional regulator
LTDDKAANRPEYQAPALEKGLEIIEYLSNQAVPHGMMDIAAALGRSRNEIYRMLIVLERRGYLERQADDRYELTNQLFEIAMRAPPRRNLHEAALPLMHQLSDTLYQSCHLVVRSGDDMVVVARVESPDLLGFAVRLGYRRPILTSTTGRILYAFMPERAREIWRAQLEKIASSERELADFLKDAEKVRAKGYHVGPSAFVDAITDLGVPIFDGESEGAAASLVIPFVSGRSARSTIDEALEALGQVAAAVGKSLQNG